MENIFILRHGLSSIGGKNYLQLNEEQLRKEIKRILFELFINFQKHEEAYYLLPQKQRIEIFFYQRDLNPTEECLNLFEELVKKKIQEKKNITKR